MDMRKLVGRNLRRVRIEKGFTQEQLAERSGFSQQFLSEIENGKRNPSVVTVFEIAQALDVSHMKLVEPDEEALEGKPAAGESTAGRKPKRRQ